MESYVLVHTEMGRATEAAEAIAALEGIRFCETVTGPYDVVARADTASEDVLLHRLEERIRAIPGVVRTVACPVARHERAWERATEPALLAG
jgi:DNA-binding Lrp family transcriptional regulator